MSPEKPPAPKAGLRPAPRPEITPGVSPDITPEIRMLRHVISRLYQQSQDVDDVDDQTRILGALSLAINRLCSLIKAQGGDGWQDEKSHRAAEALAQALDEISREWEASA